MIPDGYTGPATPEEIIKSEREQWSQQFGGGIIPFDDAYWDALGRNASTAEAQRQGCNRLLDAFAARLIEALSE